MEKKETKGALPFLKWALFLALVLIVVFYFSRRDWLGPITSDSGRTNFLLLGIPGGVHDGEDLTDALIFFSINQQTGDSLLLSLPRDIWVDSLRAKLNTIYHYRGLATTKKIVSEILDQPVHYAVLLDFGGFVQAVDALEGIDVEIERTFDDYRYPIPGKENDDCDGDPGLACRYEHLHFDAGRQHLDGERALKYVRSRYAEGEEGSDFARSRRQQRLLVAVRSKLLSRQVLTRPRVWQSLYEVVKQSVKTDINPQDYFGLARLALKFDSRKMQTEVLDFLITPPKSTRYDFHWVLVPRTDWNEIHQHVKEILNLP